MTVMGEQSRPRITSRPWTTTPRRPSSKLPAGEEAYIKDKGLADESNTSQKTYRFKGVAALDRASVAATGTGFRHGRSGRSNRNRRCHSGRRGGGAPTLVGDRRGGGGRKNGEGKERDGGDAREHLWLWLRRRARVTRSSPGATAECPPSCDPLYIPFGASGKNHDEKVRVILLPARSLHAPHLIEPITACWNMKMVAPPPSAF